MAEEPDLDTITGARAWLVDPKHWHESRLFILKWDGLLPTVMNEHGRRLIAEPWDDGLPWAVVYERRLRRKKREQGEPIEDQDQAME
jgi:hypothetical protein